MMHLFGEEALNIRWSAQFVWQREPVNIRLLKPANCIEEEKNCIQDTRSFKIFVPHRVPMFLHQRHQSLWKTVREPRERRYGGLWLCKCCQTDTQPLIDDSCSACSHLLCRSNRCSSKKNVHMERHGWVPFKAQWETLSKLEMHNIRQSAEEGGGTALKCQTSYRSHTVSVLWLTTIWWC